MTHAAYVGLAYGAAFLILAALVFSTWAGSRKP